MNVYCEVCQGEMEIMRDLGTELHVYPCGCSGKQAIRPTPYALDAASAAPAEHVQNSDIVTAGEVNTQPRQ